MRRGMLVPPAVGLLAAFVLSVCCLLVTVTGGSVSGTWLRKHVIPISVAFPSGPRFDAVVVPDGDGYRVIQGEILAGDGSFEVDVPGRADTIPAGKLAYTVEFWSMRYAEGFWGGTRQVTEQRASINAYQWYPDDDAQSAMKPIGLSVEDDPDLQRVLDAAADLAEDLDALISRHRELWLRRSRSGGLERSASVLQRVVDALRAG